MGTSDGVKDDFAKHGLKFIPWQFSATAGYIGADIDEEFISDLIPEQINLLLEDLYYIEVLLKEAYIDKTGREYSGS